MEVFGILEFLFNTLSLFQFGTLTSNRCLLTLLVIELIAQIFLEFFFRTALVFFSLKSFEYLVPSSLCSILSGLDLPKSLLLLVGVSTHHLVFELLHFLLTSLEGTLLINTENHICLGLIHFQIGNSSHFTVFVDHFLYDIVNLLLLACVLLVSFIFDADSICDLLLNLVLHAQVLLSFSCFFVSGDLVLNFLSTEHNLINVGVLLLLKEIKGYYELTISIWRRYCCSAICAARSLF